MPDLLSQLNKHIDEEYYYATYPDVKEAGISAFNHYMSAGAVEGRNPNAKFNILNYYRQFPHLRHSGENPLIHYILHGEKMGALYEKPQIIISNYNMSYEELSDAAFPNPDIRVLAWYLPQFHPIAENDMAWGKGFTEWTNVAAARPRFSGHYQPRIPGALGFYDLRRKDTLREQIELAKHAGIYGFCLHHYWFHGHKALRTPLEWLREDPELDFPFCLHWANEHWSRRWDGGSDEVIISQQYSARDDIFFLKDIEWALKDKRYIRFNGNPVLGIYRPDLFPDIAATIVRWRKYCRQIGIGEIFLFASLSFHNTLPQIINYGFDGAVEYPPHGLVAGVINNKDLGEDSNFLGIVRSYPHTRNAFLDSTSQPYHFPCFRGVMPDWDNSARSDSGVIFVGADSISYQEWLQRSVALAQTDAYLGEKYLFVNAWNEWAEGAYLEPDRKRGFAMLNATAKVISDSPNLPHLLIVANIDSDAISANVEKFLIANKRHPIFNPIILIPHLFQTIGTFKGLAPVITTSSSQFHVLKKLLIQSGYPEISACLIWQELSQEKTEALAQLFNIIICRDNIKEVNFSIAEKIWILQSFKNPTKEWQLHNIATGRVSNFLSLMQNEYELFSKNIAITTLIIPSATNQISFDNIEYIHTHAPFSMELIVPIHLQEMNSDNFKYFSSFPMRTQVEYIRKGITQAKGEYIYFFFSDSFPQLQKLLKLYGAFLISDSICASISGFKPDEPLINIERDTIELPGKVILAAANKNKKKVLQCTTAALFKKNSLLKGLDKNIIENEDFLEALCREVYKESTVALMPED